MAWPNVSGFPSPKTSRSQQRLLCMISENPDDVKDMAAKMLRSHGNGQNGNITAAKSPRSSPKVVRATPMRRKAVAPLQHPVKVLLESPFAPAIDVVSTSSSFAGDFAKNEDNSSSMSLNVKSVCQIPVYNHHRVPNIISISEQDRDGQINPGCGSFHGENSLLCSIPISNSDGDDCCDSGTSSGVIALDKNHNSPLELDNQNSKDSHRLLLLSSATESFQASLNGDCCPFSNSSHLEMPWSSHTNVNCKENSTSNNNMDNSIQTKNPPPVHNNDRCCDDNGVSRVGSNTNHSCNNISLYPNRVESEAFEKQNSDFLADVSCRLSEPEGSRDLDWLTDSGMSDSMTDHLSARSNSNGNNDDDEDDDDDVNDDGSRTPYFHSNDNNDEKDSVLNNRESMININNYLHDNSISSHSNIPIRHINDDTNNIPRTNNSNNNVSRLCEKIEQKSNNGGNLTSTLGSYDTRSKNGECCLREQEGNYHHRKSIQQQLSDGTTLTNDKNCTGSNSNTNYHHPETKKKKKANLNTNFPQLNPSPPKPFCESNNVKLSPDSLLEFDGAVASKNSSSSSSILIDNNPTPPSSSSVSPTTLSSSPLSLDGDTMEWRKRVKRSVSLIRVNHQNPDNGPKVKRRVSSINSTTTRENNNNNDNNILLGKSKTGSSTNSILRQIVPTTATTTTNNTTCDETSYVDQLKINSDGVLVNNSEINNSIPINQSNQEPVRRISAIDQSDFGLLKVATTRLNLPTRRPSVLAWKEKYMNGGYPFQKRTNEEEEGGKGVVVVVAGQPVNRENPVTSIQQNEKEEGVEEEKEKRDDVVDGFDDKRVTGTNWKLTSEDKGRINGTLAWLRQELINIRLQDQSLARQFLNLRQSMNAFRLAVECEDHQELIDEAEEDIEELRALSKLVDLPPEILSPLSPLKQVGITRMNISSRRFSTC